MKKPAEVIEGPKDLTDVKGEITFNNVTFNYTDAAPVIEDFSFKINEGDFVGVIG